MPFLSGSTVSFGDINNNYSELNAERKDYVLSPIIFISVYKLVVPQHNRNHEFFLRKV